MKHSNFVTKAMFAAIIGAASTVAFAQTDTMAAPGSANTKQTQGGPNVGDGQQGGAKTGKTASDRASKAPGAAAVGRSADSNMPKTRSPAPGSNGPLVNDNYVQSGANTGKTGSDNTMKSGTTANVTRPTGKMDPDRPGTPGGPYTSDANQGGAKTGKTASGK